MVAGPLLLPEVAVAVKTTGLPASPAEVAVTVFVPTAPSVHDVEIDQTDQLSWILSRNEDGTYALDFSLRRTF